MGEDEPRRGVSFLPLPSPQTDHLSPLFVVATTPKSRNHATLSSSSWSERESFGDFWSSIHSRRLSPGKKDLSLPKPGEDYYSRSFFFLHSSPLRRFPTLIHPFIYSSHSLLASEDYQAEDASETRKKYLKILPDSQLSILGAQRLPRFFFYDPNQRTKEESAHRKKASRASWR